MRPSEATLVLNIERRASGIMGEVDMQVRLYGCTVELDIIRSASPGKLNAKVK